MTCPECQGMGIRADPDVMQLIFLGLTVGHMNDAADRIDEELKRRKKASGQKGKYWMVGDCPRCNGTGTI